MSKKRNLFAGLICLVLAFVCLVSCGEITQSPEALEKQNAETAAQEVLNKLVWDAEDRTAIVTSISLATSNKNYPNVSISWTSSEPDVISEKGKVTRPAFDDERAYEDGDKKLVKVILTATVVASYGENTTDPISKQFEFTVQVIPEGLDMGSIEDVKARAWTYIYETNSVKKDLTTNKEFTYKVQLTGIVTAKLNADTRGFMIHDGSDGIYVYATTEGLEVGDTVTVIGGIYSYYGSLQVGTDDTSWEKVDPVDNMTLPEYTLTTPTEWEAKNAPVDGVFADDVIGHFGGDLYKVEGLLVRKDASAGSGKYCIMDPLTGEETWIYYKSYSSEMEEEIIANVDKYVVVPGVSYDRDSRINKNEILFVGGIEEAVAPEITDEQQANVLLSQITLGAEYAADFELSDLGAWEVVSGTGVEIVEGAAKVTLGSAEQVVVLKVTVTYGEAVVSKEFTVKLPSATFEVISLEEALKLASAQAHNTYTADKYYVVGTITEIKNATYGNMYISDGVNTLYVYGVYVNGAKFGEATDPKPEVGQVVLLKGVLGTYNDATQMKNADLVSFEYGTNHETIANKEASELGAANPSYTADKYNIKGVVTKIANATYGNLYVKDIYGNEIYVYGVYNVDGSVRYDALENAPKVGDFVVLSGILGAYNGTPQMKNAWLLQLNGEDYAAGETPKPPVHEHVFVEGKCECGEVDPNYQPSVQPTEGLKEGQAYKLQLVQTNAGKTVYFTGAMSSYYYATSEDVNAGVDVYAEIVDGGYNLYFVDKEGAKHYMGIVASGTHVNAVFDGEKTVFTYSEDLQTVTAVVADEVYVFGTRNDNTYTTIGANKVSYNPFTAKLVIIEDGEPPVHEHVFVEGKCECGEADPNYSPVEPTDKEVTIAEALQLADGTEVIVKGTVDAVEAWNNTYGNMNFTLKDATGTLYVFRVYTKVALGDIVTVEGAMASYYESRQIAQGATITITGHDDSYDQVVEGTTTITFDETSKRTVFTTEQQVWVENGITVTNNKANSTSDVADYSDPARFYASSQLIIESEKSFTKITFKTNSKNFSSDFTVEGATVTVNGTECVIEFTEAVTSFEIAKLPYQVRVSYITIA